MTTTSTHSRAHTLAVKVPQITVMFWVIKLLTTGMGEAASDFLGAQSKALAGAVGLIGICAALWWQLRAPRYSAVIYWTAVAMVAVFGTMAADGLHVVLGIPYPITTAFYIIAVAVVFTLWYRSEGTLSIHSIDTRRREYFYWTTVLATFALGTAAGDFTAYNLNLGYRDSAILFAIAILIPLLVWRLAPGFEIATFWAAYVLTRPLGASIADWLGKPSHKGGGLGIGDGVVTLVLIALIVLCVGYIHRRDSLEGSRA